MQSVYLIGAGNLATQLGGGLRAAGLTIAGVFSKTMESAKELGDKLHCTYTDSYDEISPDAGIYLLCIKDDALQQELPLHIPEGAMIAHTSGTTGINVLEKYSASYGSFYPLYSFTKDKEVPWQEIPFCIEASDDSTKNILLGLARKLSTHIYELNSEQRAGLHLAAVWANNFTNHLFHIAENICRQENIPFSILEPIAYETIKKVFSEGAFRAQTGPALRGDRKTLEKHLRKLGEDEINSSLYIMLSKAIRDAHAGMN